MIKLPFEKFFYERVSRSGDSLIIGGQFLPFDEYLDFDPPIGIIQVRNLVQAAEAHISLTGAACPAQLGALAFAAGATRALDPYFPIIRLLNPEQIDNFYRLLGKLMRHPRLNIRLLGENHVDLTPRLPLDSRAIIAGHLAELFFFREDILERLLSTTRHIRLYPTTRAFTQDGGVAGGDYNPSGECIQLLLSRLYEGFSQPTPGVAPFLHEFGHMLDHFDASTARMGGSRGLLPGLSPEDGAIYRPNARRNFLEGKRLELERYQRRLNNQFTPNDPLPIGHPYVFQNNSEFIAGYLEMFFRNPHYFAKHNPQLYESFVETFGHDPRLAWETDYAHYINDNQTFYLSGQRPWPTGLTVPDQ